MAMIHGALARLGRQVATPPGATAAMLVVATILSLLMAILAPINQRPELWRGPPDEYAHRSTARYYVDHWLPPRVGDPGSLDTYSRDYGYSYINDTDLAYPLAGKFAAALGVVGIDPDRGFRLFDVLLLAILAAACIARPRAWPVFVPLLLSPQVWYIFSYFNSDAFPLFLAVLIAAQVMDRDSLFNRFLDTPGLGRHWWGALLMGVLAGLLLLSKKNFLSFLALVPVMLALMRLGRASALVIAAGALAGAAWFQGWFAVDRSVVAWLAAALAGIALAATFARAETRGTRLRVIAKIGVLAILAVGVLAPRYWWDAKIHGSLEEKRLAIGKVQEQIAKPEYKPSVIYNTAVPPPSAFYGLELRARGTPLAALFAPPWSWHWRTFTTATGNYGWLEFTAPEAYYDAMLAGYLALLGLYGWGVVRSRDASVAIGFGLVAAFSALTVGVALFHSWNNDFQAQGRYLFPIVAILGMGLHQAREWIPRRAMLAVVAFCFALSACSFVFVGLRNVAGSFT